jgi:hypothetical protein
MIDYIKDVTKLTSTVRIIRAASLLAAILIIIGCIGLGLVELGYEIMYDSYWLTSSTRLTALFAATAYSFLALAGTFALAEKNLIDSGK